MNAYREFLMSVIEELVSSISIEYGKDSSENQAKWEIAQHLSEVLDATYVTYVAYEEDLTC